MEHLILHLLKSSKGRTFLAVVLTIVGSFWIYRGSTDSRTAAELRQSQSFAMANLVDVKTFDLRKPPREVEVEYSFDPPGMHWGHKHSQIAEFGERWAKIPYEAWGEIERSNHLQIVYLAQKPEINLPVCALASQESSGKWTLRLGIIATVIGGAGIAWRLANLIRLEPPPLVRQVQSPSAATSLGRR